MGTRGHVRQKFPPVVGRLMVAGVCPAPVEGYQNWMFFFLYINRLKNPSSTIDLFSQHQNH